MKPHIINEEKQLEEKQVEVTKHYILSEETMTELFCCPVLLDTWDEAKTLPCGHSFDKSAINNLIIKYNDEGQGYKECPSCRSRTSEGMPATTLCLKNYKDKSPYICTLTQYIFYQPATLPCGHTFELSYLQKIHRRKCPNCNQVFANTPRFNTTIKALIAYLIVTKQILPGEQYFSAEHLLNAIRHKKQLRWFMLSFKKQLGEEGISSFVYPNSDKPLLRWLIEHHFDLLIQYNFFDKELLNEIIYYGEYKNQSSLLWLANDNYGKNYIYEHRATFIKLIDIKIVKRIIKKNQGNDFFSSSVLHCLLVTNQNFFSSNSSFSTLIDEPQLLNFMDKKIFEQCDEKKELVAPHGLLKILQHDGLRDYLKDHQDVLFNLLSKIALNRLKAPCNHSALVWLAGYSGFKKTLSYIINNNWIEKKTLNAIIPADAEGAGESVLFWLCARANEYHNDDAIFIKDIEKKTFNHCITYPCLKGRSPLFYLTTTVEGLALLAKNSHLIDLIDAKTFNAMVSCHNYEEQSPLLNLLNHLDGQKLFIQYPQLFLLINTESIHERINFGCNKNKTISLVLLEASQMRSAFFRKAREINDLSQIESRKIHLLLLSILSSYPCQKLLATVCNAGVITKLVLNAAIPSHIPRAEQSVLFWLCRFGGKMLMKEEKILSIIDEKAFNYCLPCEEEKDNILNGSSPAFWLVQDKYGHQLLSRHPQLFSIIDKLTFAMLAREGQYVGHPLLCILLKSALTKNIFFERPALFKIILTKIALNKLIIDKGANNESALLWLVNSAKGCELLNKIIQPNLIERKTLYAITHQGYSVLFYLLQYEPGRKLLEKFPALFKNMPAKILNTIITTNQIDRQPALFFLLKKSETRDFISNELKLSVDCLTRKTLTYCVETGKDHGCSVLLQLAMFPEFHQLLREVLRSKLLDKKVLNAIVQGKNNHHGESVLFWLCYFEDHHHLLANNFHIIKNIDKKSFNHLASYGKYQGCSPLFFLTKTEHGIALLSSNPLLLKFIEQTTLNHIIVDGLYAAQSVLCNLCKTPNGIQLLQQFSYYIRASSLYYVSGCRNYEEPSAYDYLQKNSLGKKLIKRYQWQKPSQENKMVFSRGAQQRCTVEDYLQQIKNHLIYRHNFFHWHVKAGRNLTLSGLSKKAPRTICNIVKILLNKNGAHKKQLDDICRLLLAAWHKDSTDRSGNTKNFYMILKDLLPINYKKHFKEEERQGF
ncbi:MAG: hypothetical protein JKY13_01640 [Gammaproteobacteria bacterium]|nr:hypothetical protein [Gammaproteobacteria bacterium]